MVRERGNAARLEQWGHRDTWSWRPRYGPPGSLKHCRAKRYDSRSTLTHRGLGFFSGGAGYPGQDLKTCAASGSTGVCDHAGPRQNTTGVAGIHLVPADFSDGQMDAVFGESRREARQDRGMAAQLATTMPAIVAGGASLKRCGRQSTSCSSR